MNNNRVVKTEMSRNGYLIFRLVQVQGVRIPRTVKVFGYGMTNKLWVRIFGLNGRETTFIPELAIEAKAAIGSWSK